MSLDPAAENFPELRTPRVLSLHTDGPGSRLAGALAAAGYVVDSVTQAADLAQALRKGSYDAVLLDLPGADPDDPALKEVAGALGGRARPAVLAVSAARPPSGQHATAADLWIAPEPADRALMEIEAAISGRRLARALDEIERLRETVLFARHVAHELAQPLTTILARGQLLLGSLKPVDPHHRAVSIICREADRLARMVEEFRKLREMTCPPDRPQE